MVKRSIASRMLLFLLKCYKEFISPLILPACRFTPTCSEYAVLAVKKYGAMRGGMKALYRVLRCNPFSKGGIDYP